MHFVTRLTALLSQVTFSRCFKSFITVNLCECLLGECNFFLLKNSNHKNLVIKLFIELMTGILPYRLYTLRKTTLLGLTSPVVCFHISSG